MPHGIPETALSGVFYIGLGDRFDDDRRRIRLESNLDPDNDQYEQTANALRSSPVAGQHIKR
jgi:hypothetical protein